MTFNMDPKKKEVATEEIWTSQITKYNSTRKIQNSSERFKEILRGKWYYVYKPLKCYETVFSTDSFFVSFSFMLAKIKKLMKFFILILFMYTAGDLIIFIFYILQQKF